MGRPDEDDENIMEAVREGRHAEDIMVFDCLFCGAVSYYNEGSHATCRECGEEANVDSEDFNCYSLAEYWEREPYPQDDPRRNKAT